MHHRPGADLVLEATRNRPADRSRHLHIPFPQPSTPERLDPHGLNGSVSHRLFGRRPLLMTGTRNPSRQIRRNEFMTSSDHNTTRLEHLRVALGWDPVRRSWPGAAAKDIDLNVAALLFAEDHITDVVYHQQLSSRDGSIRHCGDSTTGEGKGDNEVITVDLSRISPQITTVLFLVTSYTGQTFDQIENAFCRVVDTVSGAEIAHYDLSADASHTGLVMGKVARDSGMWRFEPIGEAIRAQHPLEAITHTTRFLT
jgi:tellurium resistance protein TerZ